MAKRGRLQITPSPQFSDKLDSYMKRAGYTSKAQAVRSILHSVALDKPVKM